ncbi:hypothetical protein BCEP4_1320005 [Burkholderia cepacia]|nr:hypothetical protein BCEP4_1320005 [Burkholderia cepacia]
MREDAAQAARPAREDPAGRPLSAHEDHAARVPALIAAARPVARMLRLVHPLSTGATPP